MRDREAAQAGDIESQHDDRVDGYAGGNLLGECHKSWLLSAHWQNDCRHQRIGENRDGEIAWTRPLPFCAACETGQHDERDKHRACLGDREVDGAATSRQEQEQQRVGGTSCQGRENQRRGFFFDLENRIYGVLNHGHGEEASHHQRQQQIEMASICLRHGQLLN